MNLWDAHRKFQDGEERIVMKHDLAIYAAKRDLKEIAYKVSHSSSSIEEFDEHMDEHIDAYLKIAEKIDAYYAQKANALLHTEVDDD